MAGAPRVALGELAGWLEATLDGDPTAVVSGVAALGSAGAEDVAIVADARNLAAARQSRAGALVVRHDVVGLDGNLLRCAEPRAALVRLLEHFHPTPPTVPGVHATAVIGAGAAIDPSASIGPLAVVGAGARIGPRARVGPLAFVGPGVVLEADAVAEAGVVLLAGTVVGRSSVIHAGAVLGADGFGYVAGADGPRKVPQVGRVRVGHGVEIGANTTVDRGTLGDTVVGDQVKLDNLVQVAHNVRIGRGALVAAQAGIAGSAEIGAGAMLGGQAGVGDHVTVGPGAALGGQTGAAQDVEAGARVSGMWARPLVQARRIWLAEAELPELLRRVRELETRLAALESRARGTGDG